MPRMLIEFLSNFCYNAMYGTWVVTHYRGLRVNHSKRYISKTRCYPDLSRKISYFCTSPSPVSGVGVRVGVGDGSEREESIVSVTFTVTAVPTDGVMITVAVYVPAFKPVTFTLKVIGVVCPAVLLPVEGETVNQGCD